MLSIGNMLPDQTNVPDDRMLIFALWCLTRNRVGVMWYLYYASEHQIHLYQSGTVCALHTFPFHAIN